MNYSTVNCSILQQNIVMYHKKTMFYYKMRYFTTECGNSIGYTITNSSILLQSSHSKKYHKYITNIPQIYHKSTTKCDIVPQKCDIVPQNRVFYYKM